MLGNPRVRRVTACGRASLAVEFDNGAEKVYDCTGLLARPEFELLRTPAFFRAVRVDPGGYGISWNDRMDLSADELWANGTLVRGGAAAGAQQPDASRTR
jgi:hypothetical protein